MLLLNFALRYAVKQTGQDGLEIPNEVGQGGIEVMGEAGQLLSGKRAAIQFYYNKKFGHQEGDRK